MSQGLETPNKRKKKSRRLDPGNNDPNTPHQHIAAKHRSSKKKASKRHKSSDPGASPQPPASSNLRKSRIRRNRASSDAQSAPYPQHNADNLMLAAYKKDDIVIYKDNEKMCVIKTIRKTSGLQYGIIIPPESNIRYIKPQEILKKLKPESIIQRLDQLKKQNVSSFVNEYYICPF